MRRAVLAVLAAPALLVLAAPPSSAGCLEDYLTRPLEARQYVDVDPSGPTVTVYGGAVVDTVTDEVGYVGRFVDCTV